MSSFFSETAAERTTPHAGWRCCCGLGDLDRQALAVLADAREEAGCADEALLAHLRGPGHHVPGCWAVDALTGMARGMLMVLRARVGRLDRLSGGLAKEITMWSGDDPLLRLERVAYIGALLRLDKERGCPGKRGAVEGQPPSH